MEIKDIQARQGNIDLVLTVVSKEEPRTFEKFGKEGRVCNAKVKDESGEVTLTLWNEQVEQVGVGDKIHLQNGWCSEFRGERQLSAGKFGKIELVEKGEAAPVMTNDPSMLQPAPQGDDLQAVGDEEELVE
jgi:replication factor A1